MILWNISLGVVCAAILAMHILSSLLRGRGAAACLTVGLCLHVPLFLLLLLVQAPMDVSVLVFLLSLLVYTGAQTLARRRRTRSDRRTKEDEV